MKLILSVNSAPYYLTVICNCLLKLDQEQIVRGLGSAVLTYGFEGCLSVISLELVLLLAMCSYRIQYSWVLLTGHVYICIFAGLNLLLSKLLCNKQE